MIVDCHAHFQPRSLTQPTATASQLVSAMDGTGVSSAIVSSIVGSIEDDNEATALACEEHGSRVFGYINLNLRLVKRSYKELDKYANRREFKGVKLHPSNHSYFPFSREYYPIYERIESEQLPVLWHSGTYPYSTPLQIAAVARDFPEMGCVLAHFGLDLWAECFPAAEMAENIYIDTTIAGNMRAISAWIDDFGAERALWGSDFPLYNVALELSKLPHLLRETDELKQIRGENAIDLFGIPKPESIIED